MKRIVAIVLSVLCCIALVACASEEPVTGTSQAGANLNPPAVKITSENLSELKAMANSSDLKEELALLFVIRLNGTGYSYEKLEITSHRQTSDLFYTVYGKIYLKDSYGDKGYLNFNVDLYAHSSGVEINYDSVRVDE